MKTQFEALANKAQSVGLRLDYDLEHKVGSFYQPTPKSKHQNEKRVYVYRYRSVERMFEDLNSYCDGVINSKQANEAAKAVRKERNKIEAESVNVGDVFVSSWGWEQTNIEFYQVVSKPSKATVVLRRIAPRTVRETGWASADVAPVVDAFIGEEEKHRLSGQWITFNSYKSARKTDPNQAHHSSWYA